MMGRKKKNIAEIDPDSCMHCFECIDICPLNAINDDLAVDGSLCDGCGKCEENCPSVAIELVEIDTT